MPAGKPRGNAAMQKCPSESESLRRSTRRTSRDAIGALQWSDFRSGRVRRWTVRVGDRIDRITLESPGGKRTDSHGWTWILDRLRSHLCGRGTTADD